MFLLDANILLRYLTNDDPKKAACCESLFSKAAAGKEKLLLNHLIIAETVRVLEGIYKLPKNIIADCFMRILNTPGIIIPDADLILLTFDLWKSSNYKIDYIDAYNAAWIKINNLPGIYSYDKNFDKIKIKRKEPQ